MKRNQPAAAATIIFLFGLAVQAIQAGPFCIRMESPVVTFYFGIESAIPDPNEMETIDFYHTDLDTPYLCDAGVCGWAFTVSSNDQPGGGDRQIPLHKALLYANPSARMTMPSSGAFAFIGAAPGSTIWVLPQNYVSGVLWLGLNSGEMSSQVKSHLCFWNPQDARGANTSAQWLAVQLVDVRGPQDGYVSLWQTLQMGQIYAFFSSFDGISMQDVYYYPAGSHAHLNWGFTQPGLYEVDLKVSTFYLCDNDLTADLTGDCFVNMKDAAELGVRWLQTGCTDPNWCGGADLSQSGIIDSDDLAELAEQWLLCGSPFINECPF